MSDFYQILKREIEPENTLAANAGKAAALSVEKKPVENFRPNNKSIPRKKNKPVARPGKKKSTGSKKMPGVLVEADSGFLPHEVANPIWLSMSEAAKLGGIQKRTIKRAVRAGSIKFRIVESRYQVDLRATLLYLFSTKKLWNKLKESGIGQYIEKWKG